MQRSRTGAATRDPPIPSVASLSGPRTRSIRPMTRPRPTRSRCTQASAQLTSPRPGSVSAAAPNLVSTATSEVDRDACQRCAGQDCEHRICEPGPTNAQHCPPRYLRHPEQSRSDEAELGLPDEPDSVRELEAVVRRHAGRRAERERPANPATSLIRAGGLTHGRAPAAPRRHPSPARRALREPRGHTPSPGGPTSRRQGCRLRRAADPTRRP